MIEEMGLKIISEIGINHNGDFKLIEELIRQSKIGGADFVKFQLYDSVRVFGDDSRKKNEFTFDQVKSIKELCELYEIEFFASVFDEEKIDWCLSLGVNYFKIASRTIVKEPQLFEKIVKTQAKCFASLGMWTSDHLPIISDNLCYFNCISKYPTSVRDVRNHKFRKYDSNVVGLSDHSYGIANCLYHVSLGARVIEKHFTLSKSMTGNDHIGSMDMGELKTLRELGDQITIFQRETQIT